MIVNSSLLRISPARRVGQAAGLACLLLSVILAQPSLRAAGQREAKLGRMRAEIERLETELRQLSGRERGLLGEIERAGAELRLREAELAETTARLDSVHEAIGERNRSIEELQQAQSSRSSYLAFRLREIYKAGANEALRRLIGDENTDQYLTGLRYASYLSEKDGSVLLAFREDRVRLSRDRERLLESQASLSAVQTELQEATQRLESSRRQRSRLLRQVRDDQAQRRTAIDELRAAATELGSLVDSFEGRTSAPTLDMRKFRGLLDWPTPGRVSAGFGTVVHPRFKTRVPHPGLDIAGRFGAPIHAVFDGQVVFAAWMRGYGLTTIVDHGGGLLSIYAHASVLLVEAGERVGRGQSLGTVGDTGSLKGPHLYFELRIDGKPTDPLGWLRPRS